MESINLYKDLAVFSKGILMKKSYVGIAAMLAIFLLAFFGIYTCLGPEDKTQPRQTETEAVANESEEDLEDTRNTRNLNPNQRVILEKAQKHLVKPRTKDTRKLDPASGSKNSVSPDPLDEGDLDQPSDPQEQYDAQKMEEQMVKEQISAIYGDLFNELSLPKEKQDRLINHYSSSLQTEQQFVGGCPALWIYGTGVVLCMQIRMGKQGCADQE